jgi:transitional endoplasmic reticulum ATPase
MATTNRPKSLDPALTRPGRLDLVLEIPPLDFTGRVEALRVHTRDVTLDDDVDLDALARVAVGYTGAELRHVVKEAALAALRQDMNAVRVRHEHFTIASKSSS